MVAGRAAMQAVKAVEAAMQAVKATKAAESPSRPDGRGRRGIRDVRGKAREPRARLPARPDIAVIRGPRDDAVFRHHAIRPRGAAVLHAVDGEVVLVAVVREIAIAAVVVVGPSVSLHVKGDHLQPNRRHAADGARLVDAVAERIVWRRGARAAVGERARAGDEVAAREERRRRDWRRRRRRTRRRRR